MIKQVVVGGRAFDFDLGEFLQEHDPNRDQTVSWALSEYRDIARGLGHAKGTVDWFSLSAKHFLEIIGDIPIHEVTPRVMARFAAGLVERPRWQGHPYAKAGGELSPTSVRNYLKGVKTLFSVLARVEAIPENPLASYTPPEEKNKKLPRTLTADEVRKTIEQTDPNGSAEQKRDRAILAMFYDSGCRESELCNLMMDNLKDDHFTVPVKGGDEMVYWFENGAAWELQRYLQVRPQNGASNVFLTWDGRRLTRRRVYEIVRKYMRKAGLEGRRLSPHTLRHSCGRAVQRLIGNSEITRKKLNHKDIKSTFIYSQLEDEDVKRAGEKGSPFNALGLPRGRRPKDELPRDVRLLIKRMDALLRT